MEEALGGDGMAAPPPSFDGDARARAKQVAAAHGKSNTREEGLRAIHAVLHVNTADEALQHFGIAKQRFSEWRKLLPTVVASRGNGASGPVAAFDEGLLVSDEWLEKHTPGLSDFEVGPVQLSADGLQAARLVRARLDIDESGELLDALVQYEYAPAEGDSAQGAPDRRKRNRRREEHALRKLDCCAFAEHQRAKRQRRQALRFTQLPQRQALAIERRVQDTISACLEDVLNRVWLRTPDDLNNHQLQICSCLEDLLGEVVWVTIPPWCRDPGTRIHRRDHYPEEACTDWTEWAKWI
jgi:hypothetical protein